MATVRRRKGRKAKRWIADGRDLPGGRRLSFPTREQAQQALADMVKQSDQARPPAADRDIVFNAYADRWLEQIAASVDPHTVRSYRENLQRYARPVFGRERLRELHRGHLKALLAKKRNDGLAKNSVRALRAVLSVMLGDAVDDGILQHNPATGLVRRGRKRPDTISHTERQEKIRVMDYAQLATFLAAARARCTPLDALFFLLMADAGLRPGEACGVQWADVDLGRRSVRIERAVTNSGRIKGTKTGTSRDVDCTPRLVAALRDQRTALELEALVAGAAAVSSAWVFARPGGHGATRGTPHRPYAVSRLFDRLVVAAGLPRFVLYDLRHSYASHLIAQRADPGYVARQMGHSSVATTLSFYAHWFPKDDRRLVEQLEQVRAAAVPRPLPADDAGLPLSSDSAMAPLWHHRESDDLQPRDSAEAVGSVEGQDTMSSRYHMASEATARRAASSPPSR